MKLSKLIKHAVEALGKYGDLEIVPCVGGNSEFQFNNEGIINLDESENKLQLVLE